MNLTVKNNLKTSDYSHLNADELRAILLQKDAIITHAHCLLTKVTADRDKYKTITDELMRLAKVRYLRTSTRCTEHFMLSR